MHDIYTIERKISWSEIADRVYSYLDRNTFELKGRKVYFLSYIDSKIKYWTDSNGALSLTQYFNDIEVEYRNMNIYHLEDDLHSMLFIQAMLALIFWIREIIKSSNTASDFGTAISPLLKSVEIFLSGNNYAYTYDTDSGRVFLHKRNVEVDSAVESVKSKSLKIDLLSYIDFRTSSNLIEKQAIISRLYKYYEDPTNDTLNNNRVLIKNESKEINPISIFKDINQKFDIRHFQKEILKENGFVVEDEAELNELCDIAFYMFIEAVRIPKIIEYNSRYLDYKAKYLPGK